MCFFFGSCLPGGRGQIKQKKKTVPQKVTIAKIPRAKKKYVTRVCGLATFGEFFVIEVWFSWKMGSLCLLPPPHPKLQATGGGSRSDGEK